MVRKGNKEFTSLAQLTSDPKNARRHTPRNVGTIVDALHEVGAARSIVIDENGVVLAGNATMDAAIEAGLSKVQVVDGDGETVIAVRRTGLTAEQKTRLALYDNRAAELAEWNPDILADLAPEEIKGMFSDKELAEILSQTGVEPKDAEPQIDKAEELRQKWGTETGQIWHVGAHCIAVGDSYARATISRLMGTERAAMVVTSPPYNQNIDKFTPSGMQKESTAFVDRMAASYGDSKPEDQYRDEQVALLTMIADFLTPNGSIFYNHKIRYREKEAVSPMEWLSRLPFPVRQEIIWDRGSSITLNARMLIPADERIYWMRVGDDFIFNDTPEIKAWSTVWRIAAKNDVQISAPFATEIPTRCIQIASRKDDIILEPHSGSGTTMVAAENEGRRCYAADINAGYVAVTIERMSVAFPNLKIERHQSAVAA